VRNLRGGSAGGEGARRDAAAGSDTPLSAPGSVVALPSGVSVPFSASALSLPGGGGGGGGGAAGGAVPTSAIQSSPFLSTIPSVAELLARIGVTLAPKAAAAGEGGADAAALGAPPGGLSAPSLPDGFALRAASIAQQANFAASAAASVAASASIASEHGARGAEGVVAPRSPAVAAAAAFLARAEGGSADAHAEGAAPQEGRVVAEAIGEALEGSVADVAPADAAAQAAAQAGGEEAEAEQA
jgi:hypothetical protein